MSINLSKPQSSISALVKRLLDILASALGLLLLSPFFGIVGWAIKRDSPGPAFYRGRRAGRHGKEFHILKFRTMYERPKSYQGAKVTAQGDPRVAPVGKWLPKAYSVGGPIERITQVTREDEFPWGIIMPTKEFGLVMRQALPRGEMYECSNDKTNRGAILFIGD